MAMIDKCNPDNTWTTDVESLAAPKERGGWLLDQIHFRGVYLVQQGFDGLFDQLIVDLPESDLDLRHHLAVGLAKDF